MYNFLEAPGNFRTVFGILSQSTHSHLLYLSISSITKLLNSEWKTFSVQERTMIYQTLFSMLFSPQEKASYLMGGIAKALARVCRFGWIEIEEIKQVTLAIEGVAAQNMALLQAGFKFYEELIAEIGEPIKGRSLSLNRKIAVSFRDEALGQIFSYGLKTLSTKMQELPRNLLASVLSVVHMCLNFDFLGISSDETTEDTLCLQVPMSWKSHFENPAVFDILEFIVLNACDEVETLSLRVLNHTGAVRKSIFSGNAEVKQGYIAKYLKITDHIMRAKKLESDSLFEFINALKRFLSNFTLKDIAEIEAFDTWLQTLATFSLGLFTREEAITSGNESSMLVWNYLAFEGHHQLQQKEAQLSQFVIGLFKAFLNCTLSKVRPNILSPDNETDLKDHIEMISNFSVYYYSEVTKILEEVYMDHLNKCEVITSESFQGKFAWMIAISSGLISLRDGKTNDIEIQMDALLIQLVFQTISKIPEAIECLETSYLLFFSGLSKSYINSSYEKLWFVLDNSQSSSDETINRLLTSILEKCFKNLSIISSSRIAKYSLELFEQLSKGYYSNKMMVKNELIQNLMLQYKTFPLCLHSSKLRFRIFNSLTYMWVNEDLSTPIETFLAPMAEHLTLLLESPDARNYEFVFRELEGVCFGLQNQRTYFEFFEWFYERFGIVMAACQNFLYEDKVMESMLKFLLELVYSRNSRVKFDPATSYGVVLFRNLSNVINGYGKVIIENSSLGDFFKKFYSRIRKILGIMMYLLGGAYVPFGVFEVYGDTCFVESLRTCFLVLDTVPRSEISVFYM